MPTSILKQVPAPTVFDPLTYPSNGGNFSASASGLVIGLVLGGVCIAIMCFGLFRLERKSVFLHNQNKKNEDEALNMNDKKGAKKNDSDDDDNLMSSLEKNDLTELHTTVFEAAAEQHAKLKAFLDSEGLSGHER